MSVTARDAEEVAEDGAAVLAALATALAKPAVADFTVLGERDGTETPAVALALASCSPVFTVILTDAFADGSPAHRRSRRCSEGNDSGHGDDAGSLVDVSPTRTLHTSFSGEGLAAVVEFAATNYAAALLGCDVAILRELYEAADHYDIDELGA